MKSVRILPYVFSMMLFIMTSCVKEELDEINVELEVGNIEKLEIPPQFDFSTHKEIEISISDTTSHARYSLQANSENLFTGFIVKNKLVAKIRVASETDELTLLRSAEFKEETFTVSVSEATLIFEYNQ